MRSRHYAYTRAWTNWEYAQVLELARANRLDHHITRKAHIRVSVGAIAAGGVNLLSATFGGELQNVASLACAALILLTLVVSILLHRKEIEGLFHKLKGERVQTSFSPFPVKQVKFISLESGMGLISEASRKMLQEELGKAFTWGDAAIVLALRVKELLPIISSLNQPDTAELAQELKKVDGETWVDLEGL